MGAVKKAANTPNPMDKTTEYLRGVWSELKKVHWPNRKQLLTYTGVVFVSVAIVAAMLWIVDSALTAALARVFQ